MYKDIKRESNFLWVVSKIDKFLSPCFSFGLIKKTGSWFSFGLFYSIFASLIKRTETIRKVQIIPEYEAHWVLNNSLIKAPSRFYLIPDTRAPPRKLKIRRALRCSINESKSNIRIYLKR